MAGRATRVTNASIVHVLPGAVDGCWRITSGLKVLALLIAVLMWNYRAHVGHVHHAQQDHQSGLTCYISNQIGTEAPTALRFWITPPRS